MKIAQKSRRAIYFARTDINEIKNTMRILVVDDCKDTCDILTWFLEERGFEVICHHNGKEVMRLLPQIKPSLVMLDVVLPDVNGQALCEEIRTLSDTPIIMISAAAKENSDMVVGLNLGADDYLVKPLDLRLLDARINAVLRRSGTTYQSHDDVAYSDSYINFDARNQEVWITGQRLSLSHLEYQLLELLIRNADQTVIALEINEYLWPGQAHDTVNLRAYIRRLRLAIEPDPKNPRYVVTEHGLGYRFVRQ